MARIWETVVNLYYNFIGVMSTFRIADFIEILVVAYLLYKLIQIVKQTRAKQLLGGIVAVVLAWILAEFLKMTTLSVILKSIINSGFVVLVVIFQPEIRNMLEQVSLTNISKLNRKLSSEYDTVGICIDNVCKACSQMSADKVGALIVFERQTKLGDIIKTGTLVNAETSVELVGNIFYPKAPLHDGAMIIRDGRVLAAGCILPLTQSSDLSKELGTRHRASIGMSENSDAVVVVVSEETGAISVAREGSLKRGLSSAELLDYLKNALIHEETQPDNRFTALKNKLKKGGKKSDE